MTSNRPYTADQVKIRMALLASWGSRVCDQRGCAVITQGGYKGQNAHMAIVHPGVKRVRPGEGTEIS